MIISQRLRHMPFSQREEMKRILIVDDFEPGRLVLRERLEIQGYLCHEAENGAEALKAIQTKPFDLVITDNHMPVMTGLQMLQCLADWPDDQQPPVIMLTGHLSNELSNSAQAAGACTILEKPYNAQELVSEITRILEPR